MNSGDWNVIAGHAPGCARIITRGDDALVFIGRANQQSRQFNVGPALQRGRGFAVKVYIHRCERQFAVRIWQRGLGIEIDRHHLRELQLRRGVTTPRVFHQRIKSARFHCRAGERAPIDQARLVAIALARHVFVQMATLLFADRLELPIVKRRIKCEPRRVQLFLHREIQLLLCDQHFDVSASQRWRDRGVKKRLSKRAAGEAKYFGRILTCALSALDSGRHVQF